MASESELNYKTGIMLILTYSLNFGAEIQMNEKR